MKRNPSGKDKAERSVPHSEQVAKVGKRTADVRNREGAVNAREEAATLREAAAGLLELSGALLEAMPDAMVVVDQATLRRSGCSGTDAAS